MTEIFTEVDAWKFNLIEMAKHHREHCDGNCACSLLLLRLMGERLGMKFSEEERRIFQ